MLQTLGFQTTAAKYEIVPGPGGILLTEMLSCPHFPCDYAQLALHRGSLRSGCRSFELMWLRHQDAATIKQSSCHKCFERSLVLLTPCSSSLSGNVSTCILLPSKYVAAATSPPAVMTYSGTRFAWYHRCPAGTTFALLLAPDIVKSADQSQGFTPMQCSVMAIVTEDAQ